MPAQQADQPPPNASVHIAGTGSFAAEVAEFAVAAGIAVAGLIEMLDQSRAGAEIHGLPVIGLGPPPAEAARVVIAIGGDRREHAGRLAALGWRGLAVVHPAAHVPPSTDIAEGAVVGPGVVIGAEASVGEHALLGRGTLVGHHTRIGDGVTLNPGANVAGNCRVGDGAFVGMAAVIVPGVSVGAGALVGAAALVLEDVEPGARVQGVPARPYQRPARG